MSSHAPRLRAQSNSIVAPVQPVTAASANAPTLRLTKRGTTMINYAEDGYDEDEYDEAGGRRSQLSRHLRRDQQQQQQQLQQQNSYSDDRNNNNNRGEQQQHELGAGGSGSNQKPALGIYREWMVRSWHGDRLYV